MLEPQAEVPTKAFCRWRWNQCSSRRPSVRAVFADSCQYFGYLLNYETCYLFCEISIDHIRMGKQEGLQSADEDKRCVHDIWVKDKLNTLTLCHHWIDFPCFSIAAFLVFDVLLHWQYFCSAVEARLVLAWERMQLPWWLPGWDLFSQRLHAPRDGGEPTTIWKTTQQARLHKHVLV